MNIRIEGERPEDRKTPFHKRIVATRRIPHTRSGNICTLECGHVVQTFGDLNRAEGVSLCFQCRDAAQAAGR